MQLRFGTAERADRFYDDQVLDHLNPRMREFAARQEMFFLATADRHGECDSTFRAGPPGFVQVFDARTVAYPEYRGNGVLASLGNIEENPRVGILMIDFFRDRIGLHLNGRARVLSDAEMRAARPGLPVDPVPGRRAVVWVEVSVEEAYIHCAKHIPHLAKVPPQPRGADRERDWGTDDVRRKGGDFFGAAAGAGDRAPRRAPARGRHGAAAVEGVDPDQWRREAERVLARARQRASGAGGEPFSGWFG
ncbi:pyridoxamine 5'-phosphate oxidase family protein [Streptomyces sp. XD-27]|uniref:pyridoxamine 5'-phosphate oxidase family protein n=1 Tax=Streptomyces sp. XD-27 TaxID=3062779 RepID=UPI0026F41F41|nr:pyridoxamine 5'-phosphate oxidase family protein [Streptomyces sp. XD-27]WKX74329.1 pyridoxamine 5'-phosphate oxidase family protein [Streptomyces sp. XD-27]